MAWTNLLTHNHVGFARRSASSDSLLIVGSGADEVVKCASEFAEIALHHGFLCRGGIAQGLHFELAPGRVVSAALCHAQDLERDLKGKEVAAVSIDSRLAKGDFGATFKHEDLTLISPLGPASDLAKCKSGLRKALAIARRSRRPDALAKVRWVEACFERELHERSARSANG